MSLPDLPEPNHFTLEQICIRWGCNEERLIQYCHSNMLEIGVILSDTRAYQNGGILDYDTDALEKTYSVLDGFYALSTGDVEGTFHWGDTPSDDYNCTVRKVHLSNDHPSSYYNEGEEHFIDNEYELEQRHIFLSSQLVITNYERDRFETEHNMNIDESISIEDPTSEPKTSMGIQEKRELILKGWLAGKEISADNLIEDTQEKIWKSLSNIDSHIFQPASLETIKGFFKKQTLCRFKPGRRK